MVTAERYEKQLSLLNGIKGKNLFTMRLIAEDWDVSPSVVIKMVGMIRKDMVPAPYTEEVVRDMVYALEGRKVLGEPIELDEMSERVRLLNEGEWDSCGIISQVCHTSHYCYLKTAKGVWLSIHMELNDDFEIYVDEKTRL